MREHNWSEAAKRWAVLRKVYPDQPQTWIQAAISLLKANDLEKAESLLSYARQHSPNRPNALIQSAELAIRRKEWDQEYCEYIWNFLKSKKKIR